MTFEKSPAIRISGKECIAGWQSITGKIKQHLNELESSRKILAVECYQGTDMDEIRSGLIDQLEADEVFDSSDYLFSEEQIRTITQPDVTDDRIFGRLTKLEMNDLIDPEKKEHIRDTIAKDETGLVVVFGYGASLVAEEADVLVYADMARWEIQQRMRNNEVSNIGINNAEAGIEDKYKRGFFVDWRICDKLKKQVHDRIDFVLDTNKKEAPKLIDKATFDFALEQTVHRPFSVVPFFDPGPWGGQWMREVCGLDEEPENFAWCFNCVPEENSVLYEFDNGEVMELPSINVVFFKPEELLGKEVYQRFGDEFPIRFDFLDTIDGGNLSLQVHPSQEYIKQEFNLEYTQDESYYMMDAQEGAEVYLGVKKGIDPDTMIENLKHANNGGPFFDADKYAASFPAKKHDHFLIPNGTVHCSGEGCMVLEISATPYIFTFKLWDWDRLGLDGKPRPINIERGEKVIRWEHDEEWVPGELINQFETVAEGDGWREEKTGLHNSQFIETRRHWFSKPVTHTANGSVTVFNLVEGKQAVISSPENEFEPFVVNYAETFIIPAHIKEYQIAPYGESEGKEIATIKAFVRS
ncbi:class I mannose-6-phosphate isomerase [Gracilimonas mengyeensis]|uniref:Mannose-6-phosphate isomerase, class I n=1 Tax=Gracilimonas mengyeensis TaxID=1302730 RepID=A0A521EYT1_9BACT|nr:class I mannose-6-phosphate isomerase [Gracilimonas mengyeensis]SMO89013.1 Mannose-6-phosphate isomerase, class I [Gracilimonas mengyeensis]